MIITVYPSQYTSAEEGTTHEVSWTDLVAEFAEPQVVAEKGKAPQIFFGSMKPGSTSKGDDSVDEIHCLVLDVDEIPAERIRTLEEILQKEGCAAILHSTYRHHECMRREPPHARVRIVIPLLRPVQIVEYTVMWANAHLTFGKCADPTTRSPSKAYLAPSVPPGEAARQAYIFREFKGEFLDPDEMMRRYNTQILADTEVEIFELGKERISRDMIRCMLDGSRSKKDKEIVVASKRAMDGSSYAEEGQRENTLFGIAGVLARHFPRGSADDICAVFADAIEKEAKRGGPSLRDFKDKLVRRQHDLLRRAALRRAEAAKQAAKVARAKASKEPYTLETLGDYFQKCLGEVTFDDLKSSLVLVHQNAYYVFGDGKYHFATPTSLHATVRRHILYRADDLDFEYFHPAEGDRPPLPKSADDLCRDHGDVAHRIVYTHAGTSYFDGRSATLYLSECESPQRIEPEQRFDVERWMRAFCAGDEQRYLRFCQWLSQAPDTGKALAALVLSGPSGTGKSGFAAGVAKLWGAAHGSMQNAVSSFNSQMVQSPVVFADESLPQIYAKVPTDLLRTLISAGVHEINRKNRPIAQLRSHLRVMVALQDSSKFDFGYGHTRDDNYAIGQRFLFVDGDESATKFFDHKSFVDEGGIAAHAMYLAQTVPRASARFGVETGDTGHVLTADPVAMRVADAIILELAGKVYKADEPKTLKSFPAVFVSRRSEVLASSEGLLSRWDLICGHRNVPPARTALVIALRALSTQGECRRIELDGATPTYWPVRVEVLRKRAIALGHLTGEEFDLIARIPHELPFKRKSYRLTDEDRKKREEFLAVYRRVRGKA